MTEKLSQDKITKTDESIQENQGTSQESGFDDPEEPFIIQNNEKNTPTPEEDKAIRAESMQYFGRFSTFGLNLVLGVFVGYLIGSTIDKLFDIQPVMTVFWMVCGFAFAVKELVITIKAASHVGDDKPSSTNK